MGLEERTKGFEWCAINGELEAYCMSMDCSRCPANKGSPNYNPNSSLVKTYEELQEGRKIA
jgi:hypothetical protein